MDARKQQVLETALRSRKTNTEATTLNGSSRSGKTSITVWLNADYKRQLRIAQIRTNKNQQTLIAEALDDLFTKHKVEDGV